VGFLFQTESSKIIASRAQLQSWKAVYELLPFCSSLHANTLTLGNDRAASHQISLPHLKHSCIPCTVSFRSIRSTFSLDYPRAVAHWSFSSLCGGATSAIQGITMRGMISFNIIVHRQDKSTLLANRSKQDLHMDCMSATLHAVTSFQVRHSHSPGRFLPTFHYGDRCTTLSRFLHHYLLYTSKISPQG
jgi:hypothetical protein